MIDNGYSVLGKGVYTVSEAARLARVPSARLTRWMAGYSRLSVDYPPLWEPDFAPTGDRILSVVSFSDLIEAMVIAAFYKYGVRIQTVRKAISVAAEEFGVLKPFSSQRFETDGRRIFADLKNFDPKDSGLMDVATTQRAFRDIIKPTFINIDFEDYSAVRWWPIGKQKSIVVDPKRSLGAPISDISGVPAETLFDALDVENGIPIGKSEITSVAQLFSVTPEEVKDAALFEEKYAA